MLLALTALSARLETGLRTGEDTHPCLCRQTFTRTVSRAAVGQVGGWWAAGYVNQLDPRAWHWQKADRLPVGVRSQLGACLKLPRSSALEGGGVSCLLLPQKDPCIRARGGSSRGCWLESQMDLSLTQSACSVLPLAEAP